MAEIRIKIITQNIPIGEASAKRLQSAEKGEEL
jgi:hypothetical protein